jgi:uncharacterized membrane protein (DUF485 family)
MDVLLRWSPEGCAAIQRTALTGERSPVNTDSPTMEVSMSEREEALEKITKERWRIAFILSACMLIIYFGFVLLIAFDKPLMGTLLSTGLSLGILLGVIVILSAWVLTSIYVRWANRVYDEKIAKWRK